MANDNNFLLIILIGIVLYWIITINTSENFSHSNSINKKNRKTENFSSNSKSRSSDSVLLNDRTMSNKEIFRELMAETQPGKSSLSPPATKFGSGVPHNPEQGLLAQPPVIRNPQIENQRKENIAQQYVPNKQQQMYPQDNPLGHSSERQNTHQAFNQDSYMLLPKNSLPDPKFKNYVQNDSRKALQTSDLLPKNKNADWFQVPNDKFNLLQAVDLEVPEIKIGVDTVGQSRKNATYDLRAAPPNPKFVVSPWQNSTIEPDYNTRSLC